MKKPLISVIIPVYNAEKYLSKCLKSILAQSYQNIEIIIVNDGSTDSSQSIIEEFHTKFPKVIRPFHQKNAGIAKARNNGLEHSTGEYIFFIDNDDYIDLDYLAVYTEKAEQEKTDMVIGGFRRVSETGKTLYTYKLKNTPWSAYRIQTPWARVYRAKFIKQNKLKFLDVKIGEDASFNIIANITAKKIAITDYIGYNWSDNRKSFSNTVQKKPDNTDDVIKLIGYIKTKSVLFRPTEEERIMTEYFCIKYSIWYLFYIRKNQPKNLAQNNREKIFNNLNSLFPKWQSSPLLSPFQPVGENFWVRTLVWIVSSLNKWKLDKIIFKLKI